MEGKAKKRRICANEGITGGASSTHTSTEGHEMTTSSGYDYEVFLSFRGPDTRAGFTDFLYTSMIDVGIRAYKDDEDLQKGEEFGPALLQAIEQSRISIPIFSKGYASSVWCLQELSKMVECRKTKGQKIMPIFYDVAPAEVRFQTRGYKEAFDLHQNKNRHDEGTMREWKADLEEVSSLDGWNLYNMDNRREGEFARKITQEVFNELKRAYLVLSDYLVSVDNHVDAIMEMIGAGTSETRIIGIHGMGGIGKSTIAKLIYNKLLHDFGNCCFLRDIRETSTRNGIRCLQNQLIEDILKSKRIYIKDIDEGTQTIKDRLSNKRVLLLLDDVEKNDQIDALVGKCDWLGRGSKIIITTRNKDILEVPEVDCSYELSGMDHDQSLQLFSKHAFRRDYPLDEYIGQSKRAICIARGLPLALEVIGSLLCRTKKEKWDFMLNKLESVPHETVRSKLKISYDALDDQQQHIFLDIACFFIGYDKDIMIHFWDEYKFPEEAMEVLQNISLIKIEKSNRVWMHDQLRDLGREIVRQESKRKIEEQSRVWEPKEALDLLRRPKGREEVKAQALRLHFDHERQHRFTHMDFERISNLRFLQVDGSNEHFSVEERLLWHELPSNVIPMGVFQENPNLLPQLRWLSWFKIPPTFKITNFSMEDVVILDLSRSKITHDWEGWSHMKVMKNLKVMTLTSCLCLERTPDFSANSKLERLILQSCRNLVEIDVSICQLKSLVFLDLSYCHQLRWLPDELGRDLTSLKYLGLYYCSSLERLPNTIGNLESLNELNIQETRIKELPNSIGNLKSLIKLDVSHVKIKELPDSIGQLENLKVVKMWLGVLRKIPDALWTIEKLEVIEALSDMCFKVEIGNGTYTNRSLRILRLRNVRIYKVPRLPESLIILELFKLYMNTFPDLSNLTNLKKLELCFVRSDLSNLTNTKKLELWCDSDGESDGPVEEDPMPLRIGNSSKLESLELTAPFVTTIPTDIRSLLPQLKSLKLQCPNLHCLLSLPSSLSSLYLSSECVTTLPMDMSSLLPRLQSLSLMCPNLRCLPSLPSSLCRIDLNDCKSCCSMEDLSNLKTLSDLHIEGCAISEIPALDCLENLESMQLVELQHVKILPDLSNLNKLSDCIVFDCGNLVEIQGNFPPSLRSFTISKCGSLQKLPDVSSLKRLHQFEINGCGKLNVVYISNLKTLSSLEIIDSAISEIRGLDRLENLQELKLEELQQVEILPDLSHLNNLGHFTVQDCGNLVEIQGNFPPFLALLFISKCGSLQKLPDLSSLKELLEFEIKGCRKLNVVDLSNLKTLSSLEISDSVISKIQGLDRLENLRALELEELQQVEILPDLSNLNKLGHFRVQDCGNLVEIQGNFPPYLEFLAILDCGSFQKLLDLSSLTYLYRVIIEGCGKLNVEAISSLCSEKGVKFGGDKQTKEMMNLDLNLKL